MQMRERDNPFAFLTDQCIDFGVTLIYWAWFIFGFFLFFSWRYLAASLFAQDPEIAFQRLNNRFFRIFFRLIRVTAPGQEIAIDDEAAAIRSSVIICNHLSYLDPLLLIALFPRHRTIVKARFFTMPIFGRIITRSGYLPAGGEGWFSRLMIRQMESMRGYFEAGGNLFVFPEGTRSRDGKPGVMRKGAIKIARLTGAPVYVLRLRNTDKLFPPGKFLFRTRIKNTITIRVVDRIEMDGAGADNPPPSTAQIMQRIQEAYSSGKP
jgi:1-acyl-sn-glycerol-3-phosphate acyltransferase